MIHLNHFDKFYIWRPFLYFVFFLFPLLVFFPLQNQTDEKLNKSRVVLTRIDESIVISGPDNMKPKHSKRKTPEDGFGGVMGMAKRSRVSRQEMVSSYPAISSIAQSTSLSDGLVIEEDDPFTKAMKVSILYTMNTE